VEDVVRLVCNAHPDPEFIARCEPPRVTGTVTADAAAELLTIAYLEYKRAHRGADPPGDWQPSATELTAATSTRDRLAELARSPTAIPRRNYAGNVSRKGLSKPTSQKPRVAIHEGRWWFLCRRCTDPIPLTNEDFTERVLAAVQNGDDTVIVKT
jgi:hypothetical protein